MANPFSKPKVAPVAPLPQADPVPVAQRTDTETQALAEEQRRKFAGASAGRASTFLTGSGTSAASSAVRFLGGASAT